MEVRCFYNYPLSLITKSFSTCWSEDNHISVVTERGVHIFKLIPDPTLFNPILKLSSSFLHCPKDIPTELFENDLKNYIYSWDKKDIYSFLMEETLTAKFHDANSINTHIVDAIWSPQKLLFPFDCYLVILTSSGAVQMFHEEGKKWKCAYNFSEKWHEIVRHEYENRKENGDLKKDPVAFFKNNLRRLQVTAATWSSIFGEYKKVFAYFITAHRSSEIVIWKISSVVKCDEIDSINGVNVEIILKEDLKENVSKINSLLWIDCKENNFLLIIGLLTGEILALKFIEYHGKLKFENTYKYYNDNDLLSVNCLKIYFQDEQFTEFLAVKEMFLIIIRISNDGNLLFTNVLQSPGFSITGISLTYDNNILMSTQNGKLNCIKYSNKRLCLLNVIHDNLKSNVQYFSLSHSPNSLLFLVVTSPNTLFDHLVDRNPSTLQFFITSNNDTDIVDNYFLNKTRHLDCSWDFIELIKINTFKYSKVKEISPKTIAELESLSLSELKYLYWIAVINNTFSLKFDNENVTAAKQLKEIKYCIFLNVAINNLRSLSAKINLTTQQLLTAHISRNNLKNFLEESEYSESFLFLPEKIQKLLFTTTHLHMAEKEKCIICNEEIDDFWMIECPIGHKIFRCPKSFLQIGTNNFRSCKICKESYHPSLNSEEDIKCIYCDVPTIHDNRIFKIV